MGSADCSQVATRSAAIVLRQKWAGTEAREEAGGQPAASEQADRQSRQGRWGEGRDPHSSATVCRLQRWSRPPPPCRERGSGWTKPPPPGTGPPRAGVLGTDSRTEAVRDHCALLSPLPASPALGQPAPPTLSPSVIESRGAPPSPSPADSSQSPTRPKAQRRRHHFCSRRAQEKEPRKLMLKPKGVQGAKHDPREHLSRMLLRSQALASCRGTRGEDKRAPPAPPPGGPSACWPLGGTVTARETQGSSAPPSYLGPGAGRGQGTHIHSEAAWRGNVGISLWPAPESLELGWGGTQWWRGCDGRSWKTLGGSLGKPAGGPARGSDQRGVDVGLSLRRGRRWPSAWTCLLGCGIPSLKESDSSEKMTHNRGHLHTKCGSPPTPEPIWTPSPVFIHITTIY